MTTPGQAPPPPPYWRPQPTPPIQPWHKRLPPIGWAAAAVGVLFTISATINGLSILTTHFTGGGSCWVTEDGASGSYQVDGSNAQQECQNIAKLVTQMSSPDVFTAGDSAPDDKGSVACQLVKVDAQVTVWDNSGNPVVAEVACSTMIAFGWEVPPNN